MIMRFYYFNRGALFEKVGKTRAALIDFDIAVKLKPTIAFTSIAGQKRFKRCINIKRR